MASPQYYDWINKIAKIKRWTPRDMLSDPTYDYEIFYKKYPNEANRMLREDEEAHFNDIGKTAFHPTFSDESHYSGKLNLYRNPRGITGGRWNEEGNKYTLSASQIKNGWDINKTINYLNEAENNGVEVFNPNNTRVKYDGDIFGGVLPNIDVIGSEFKSKYYRRKKN